MERSQDGRDDLGLGDEGEDAKAAAAGAGQGVGSRPGDSAWIREPKSPLAALAILDL